MFQAYEKSIRSCSDRLVQEDGCYQNTSFTWKAGTREVTLDHRTQCEAIDGTGVPVLIPTMNWKWAARNCSRCVAVACMRVLGEKECSVATGFRLVAPRAPLTDRPEVARALVCSVVQHLPSKQYFDVAGEGSKTWFIPFFPALERAWERVRTTISEAYKEVIVSDEVCIPLGEDGGRWVSISAFNAKLSPTRCPARAAGVQSCSPPRRPSDGSGLKKVNRKLKTD